MKEMTWYVYSRIGGRKRPLVMILYHQSMLFGLLPDASVRGRVFLAFSMAIKRPRELMPCTWFTVTNDIRSFVATRRDSMVLLIVFQMSSPMGIFKKEKRHAHRRGTLVAAHQNFPRNLHGKVQTVQHLTSAGLPFVRQSPSASVHSVLAYQPIVAPSSRSAPHRQHPCDDRYTA